jgi:hypothetical protein
MVWSQYVQDANPTTANNDYSSDDEDDTIYNNPLELQDWITWYSDDLMNLWMSMKAYREDTGNVHHFLNNMEWTDFCEFCYQFSSKYPN